jgi:RND superfamily putative drug exporter
VSSPAAEAPTTRFAVRRDERDIGSWLGELRRKTVSRAASADPAEDATTAIPMGNPTATEAIVTERISAEQTRAIPVSRPDNVDTEVATENLNARGKTGGGGVSAADLLRREGRL